MKPSAKLFELGEHCYLPSNTLAMQRILRDKERASSLGAICRPMVLLLKHGQRHQVHPSVAALSWHCPKVDVPACGIARSHIPPAPRLAGQTGCIPPRRAVTFVEIHVHSSVDYSWLIRMGLCVGTKRNLDVTRHSQRKNRERGKKHSKGKWPSRLELCTVFGFPRVVRGGRASLLTVLIRISRKA